MFLSGLCAFFRCKFGCWFGKDYAVRVSRFSWENVKKMTQNKEELLEVFLNERRIQNLASGTIEVYRRDISRFFAYCDEKELELQDLEISDIRSYMVAVVNKQQLTKTTLNRMLTGIRQFMKWALVRGDLVQDPTENMKMAREDSPLPGVIDIETVNQIIDQPPPEKPFDQLLWLRDKTMLEMFYGSGLRLSEVCGLNANDIDLNRMLVRVTGKGGKTRIIPIGSKAKIAVTNLISEYHKFGMPLERNSPLFITMQKKRITPKQIERRVQLHAKRAGIAMNVYPHLFRHSFATHMLSNSGDIRAVQEMLGHANLNTTQIYTHLDFDHLASSYDKAHPRAQLKKN